MTYKETLDFLYSQLPAFTRIGAAAYKADLDNIQKLCSALGNPEKSLKVVHVAGTNGKGSSSHYLASILQESGYKTGLFTSPHLKDFRERFRVNGKMMSRSFVVSFVEQHKAVFEAIKPSFFEMTVALAFEWFKVKKVDIAVIETGLGGRLDSTNVVVPELSLITNIDFDHTDLLGDTLEKIAFEKAGIIKHKVPVVVSEFHSESAQVFTRKAKEVAADIWFASEEVNWQSTELRTCNERLYLHLEGSVAGKSIELNSPLTGGYQKQNLKGVYLSALTLQKLGWKISEASIIQGIGKVIENTHLMGRWQQLGSKPDIYCDTGHNTAGIKEVLNQLEHHPHKQLRIVFGMVKDKAIEQVLELMPQTAIYYFCKADLFRALDAEILMEKAASYKLYGKSYKSVRFALKAAKKDSSEHDLIWVGGSTFVVAEVL
jgi:dihydrofolate synthase / folylpolyglutamate synthase